MIQQKIHEAVSSALGPEGAPQALAVNMLVALNSRGNVFQGVPSHVKRKRRERDKRDRAARRRARRG